MRRTVKEYLLESFLSQEYNSVVHRLIEEAIQRGSTEDISFEFNRFSVTIQHAKNLILLGDQLDATESGEVLIPLPEFVAAIRAAQKGGA